MQKIISATVGPMPRPKPEGLFDDMPTVAVKFEDGTEKVLFEFYPDEIMFSAPEFVGLTEREAHELFAKKDIAYIRR